MPERRSWPVFDNCARPTRPPGEVEASADLEEPAARRLEADAAAKRFDAVVLRDREATRKLAAHAFRKGRGGLGPQGEGA